MKALWVAFYEVPELGVFYRLDGLEHPPLIVALKNHTDMGPFGVSRGFGLASMAALKDDVTIFESIGGVLAVLAVAKREDAESRMMSGKRRCFIDKKSSNVSCYSQYSINNYLSLEIYTSIFHGLRFFFGGILFRVEVSRFHELLL